LALCRPLALSLELVSTLTGTPQRISSIAGRGANAFRKEN
jgi:hypothetical protein